MDARAPVAPPYVAGPFRLEPFRGMMLAPSRVGDPSSARAFARPFREVAEPAGPLGGARLRCAATPDPALYLHEYTAGGLTVRGLVGALDLSRRADAPEQRVVLPHEGIHPDQVADLADRMLQMQVNPAPILLVHRGPAPVRELRPRPARHRAGPRVHRPRRAAEPDLGDPLPRPAGRRSPTRWPAAAP